MVIIMLKKILSIYTARKQTTPPASTRNQKENIPPLKDGRALPENIEDFKEWHIKFLNRLDKHSEKEPFNGLMAKEINIPEFIPILLRLELINLTAYDESLSLLKNDYLKSILKYFGLKTSGKKQEIIKRITSNIGEADVRATNEYSDFYILTEKGREVICNFRANALINSSEDFKKHINWILNGEFDISYRMACKENAEKPVPPGLNCDWVGWYQRGITEKWYRISKNSMNNSDNPLATATAIYSLYSGKSYRECAGLLSAVYNSDSSFDDVKDIYLEIRYAGSLLSSEIDIASYLESNILEYQFLATLDTRTCPVCGKLDGKIFSVKDKKIGVNCPPMHKECRCTTISVVDRSLIDKTQRSAIAPATGKPIKVPASMTWKEWKKQCF